MFNPTLNDFTASTRASATAVQSLYHTYIVKITSSAFRDSIKRAWNQFGKDLVMAERLLMKHIDAPGRWLQERHRCLLMNKFCGRYLREKHLHHLIIYGESVQDKYEHNRNLRNPATTSVQQAIHGLAYTIYGKPEVRRLMFEVFDFERVQPKEV